MSSTKNFLLFCISAGYFFLFSLNCFALKVNIKSDTYGRSYRIRGRDGLFSFPRTRVVENMDIFLVESFPSLRAQGKYLALRLNVNFTLDHDFGVRDNEVDSWNISSYVPLLKKTYFSLLRAFLSLRYGRYNSLEVKIGRLTDYGVNGMYGFDGVSVEFSLSDIGSLKVYSGFENVSMFHLYPVNSYSQGISWSNRGRLEEGEFPELSSPEIRPLFAGVAKLSVFKNGFLTLGYRRVYGGFAMDSVADEKLSFSLYTSSMNAPVHTAVVASYDFIWKRISRIESGLIFFLSRRWQTNLNYIKYYPSFDSLSIFNVFYFYPFSEVSWGLNFSPCREFDAGLVLLGRGGNYYDGDSNGGKMGDIFSDKGLRLTFKLNGLNCSVSGRWALVEGQSGKMAGMDFSPLWRIYNGRLIVRLMGGVYFMDYELRKGHRMITGGGNVLVEVRLYRGIRANGYVELYNNRISGRIARVVFMLKVNL